MSDRATEILIAVVLTSLIALGVFALVLVARADGRVDYCYVEEKAGGVSLMAHRPWRPDHTRGLFPSAEQATAAARAMECPLR